MEYIEAQQQLATGKTSTIRSTFVQHWKSGGVAQFYTAADVVAVGVSLNWAIYSWLYEILMFLGRAYLEGLGALLIQLLAGCLTGILTASLMNPFWVVKTRFYDQALLHTTTQALDCQLPVVRVFTFMRHIARCDGVQALFAGLIPSWLGCLEGAIQFAMFHSILDWLNNLCIPPHILALSASNGALPCMAYQELAPSTRAMVVFMLAAVARLLATILTYPYQVVRTAMQRAGPTPSSAAAHRRTADNVQPSAPRKSRSPAPIRRLNGAAHTHSNQPTSSVRQRHSALVPDQKNVADAETAGHVQQGGSGLSGAVRALLQEGGVGRLYAGLQANLLRQVPAAAVMMLVSHAIQAW